MSRAKTSSRAGTSATAGSSKPPRRPCKSVSGPAGKRDATDVAFSTDIEQNITPAKADDVNRLVPEEFKEFSRDLKARPVVEVKLKTAEREVRQLWQVGQPWPVYIDNG